MKKLEEIEVLKVEFEVQFQKRRELEVLIGLMVVRIREAAEGARCAGIEIQG